MLLAVVMALPDAGSAGLDLAAPALTLALFGPSPANERPLLPFAAALLLWIVPALALLFRTMSGPSVPAILAATILLFALAPEAVGKEEGSGEDSDDDIRFQTKRLP
jgi:hypothetical protein